MGRPSILVSQPHTSHAVAAGAAAAAGAAVVDPARYPIAPLRPNADTAAEALERSLAAFGAGEAERRRTRVEAYGAPRPPASGAGAGEVDD